MDEERLDGIALILQAIEVTIAELGERDGEEKGEQLQILRHMRDLWRKKAADERGG